MAVRGDHGCDHRLGALGHHASRRIDQPGRDDVVQPLRLRGGRGLDPPTVAGLAPLEPGYRRILVAPQPGGGLTWAEASLETPYGRAAVRWDLDGSELRVEVTVPEGAEAVLRLPGRAEETVGSGTHVRALVGTA